MVLYGLEKHRHHAKSCAKDAVEDDRSSAWRIKGNMARALAESGDFGGMKNKH